MCGIIAGITQQNIVSTLLGGLRELEYRGYDSAGLTVIDANGSMTTNKALGKVSELKALVEQNQTDGFAGIAHTRWATHGKPSTVNAHPHLSHDRFAIVHNGIIENHETLKAHLVSEGYDFISDTDSEVLAHLIHKTMQFKDNMIDVLNSLNTRLRGSYALVIMDKETPDTLYLAKKGSPLVIGLSENAVYAASDTLALKQLTDQFIFLEDNDIVCLDQTGCRITHKEQLVTRPIQVISTDSDQASKGDYPHFMLKEIYEQPTVIKRLLDTYITDNKLFNKTFSLKNRYLLKRTRHITMVACGTSYHAALVAKHWFEARAGIICQVEIASEFRYRTSRVPKRSLFVTISQSGETADTLASLKYAKEMGYQHTLTICNSPHSSIDRESDIALFTHAGKEIGVASTKAFTSQLTLLLMLVAYLSEANKIKPDNARWLQLLTRLPDEIAQAIALAPKIKKAVEALKDKQHCLFLGRCEMHPLAMEGALKLKEISYIHAEAYPAGELKHGPLALIDERMPVIALAPDNALLTKLKGNLKEVEARGGKLWVITDHESLDLDDHMDRIILDTVTASLRPIVFAIPLQLLSYYAALQLGHDIDKPRNLAKSVTVE